MMTGVMRLRKFLKGMQGYLPAKLLVMAVPVVMVAACSGPAPRNERTDYPSTLLVPVPGSVLVFKDAPSSPPPPPPPSPTQTGSAISGTTASSHDEGTADGSLRITVYYATDRKLAKGGKTYGVEPNEQKPYLSFGTVLVSIPENRPVGELPVRPWWNPFENERKYALIRGMSRMSPDVFFDNLKKAIKANPEKRAAFIYIHGYNNSFDDAARRTAQIAVDLDLPTVPVFYSWPSRAKLKDYPSDEDSALWTQSHLFGFLSDFADKSQAEDIYVIAHSLGNRPTVLALTALLEQRPKLKERFKEVILAAPDINAAVFKEEIAPRFAKLKTSVTVYASINDQALRASYKFHKWPRLGYPKGKIVPIRGVEIVDASRIPTNFMGHDYIMSNRALLTDVAYLFSGLRARERKGLRGKPSTNPEYWFFP